MIDKWVFGGGIVGVTLIGIGIFMLGAGMMQDRDAKDFGYAFGCGRVYADNKDPALDASDDRSPCYPYYKAWRESERWPR